MTPAQATTELAFAITQRKLDQARSALASGADPNVRIHQNKGLPPLPAVEWVVAGFYPMDFLRTLVEAGARLDTNGHIKQPTSMLGVALRSGNVSAASYLLDRTKVGEVEWRAVQESCNPEVAAQLLLRGTQTLDASHPAAGLCLGAHAARFVSILHGHGMRWAGVVANRKFAARLHDQIDVFLEVLRLAHRQGPEALARAIRKSKTTPLHQASGAADYLRLLDNPIVATWKEVLDGSGHTPLAAHIKAGNLVAVQALMQAGCAPPAMQQGEDRTAYGKRLLGRRFDNLGHGPCMDEVWAKAQAASLAGDTMDAGVDRTRRRVRL